MTPDSTVPVLPDTVETLLDWKLGNSDVQFNEEEFLRDFDQNAKESNDLLEAALALR